MVATQSSNSRNVRLSSMANMFRIPELRNKLLFTLLVVLAYRLGAFIPAPGIDLAAVEQLKERAETGGILGMLQLFSGGALTQFAIFALGIMPYITSSIIIQILGVVVPKIEQLQKQGAVGQRRITQYTRYLTIAIALLQSTGLVFLFHNGGGSLSGGGRSFDLVPNFTVPRIMLIVLTVTAGTALIMWMGELITQRGIGNGMSIIVFTSVVSVLPGQGGQIQAQDGGNFKLAVVIFMFILLLVAIVFIEQGQRRIPVQFPKRVVGRRMVGGQSTYIPLKVNQSGVIPVIFASSVLYLPVLLTNLLPSSASGDSWGDDIRKWVDGNLVQHTSVFYLAFYGLMIIGFAYFYTAIAFDPIQRADDIRKQGGFIPGIRPGPQTERHLQKIVSRITLPGALFIAGVALLPPIIITYALRVDSNSQQLAFGGTSVLIAVGVALETMKQVDSQLMMRNYEGFLANK